MYAPKHEKKGTHTERNGKFARLQCQQRQCQEGDQEAYGCASTADEEAEKAFPAGERKISTERQLCLSGASRNKKDSCTPLLRRF